jgi:hypothetical protein
VRYVAISRPRPRAEYYDEGPVIAGQTVIVEDEAPVETGLLDASGTKLYRVADKIRPGFIK